MKRTSLFQRLISGINALVLVLAGTLPLLLSQTAHAFPVGGQVTSRSVKLSSSKQNDTGVSYDVKFTAASSFTVKGIIVDFCSNSPIIGDSTCTAPTSFTVGASPTVTLTSGISGGTWVSGAASLNSGRTLKLTDATGNAMTGGTTVVEFTITGVHNPNTLGSFYARIITYSSNSGDIASYAAGTEGSTDATDYGGVALSTAAQLTITAKVQEQLTFCVYTTGANCAGASGTAVALGDANGVLSNYATSYTNTAKFDVSSNAQGGVAVNMKGENLCRKASPCTNADTANIIDPQGTSCTADSSSTSVEQFGMRLSALGSGVTATAPYNCAASNHAYDRANLVGTYGQQIASTAGPGTEVASTMEFSAKAAQTTEAGIYTTTLTFIATGTY